MINKRTANSYCCEDISLIENYDKAVSDTENIWHCHHRRETIENLTSYELIKLDLYYGRPASELVFLTQFDHMSLHNKGKQSRMKGKHHTQESKRKNAIAHIGNKNCLGKKHTEETKRRISENKKGKTTWMKGKHHTEESKIKLGKPVLQIKDDFVIKHWKYAKLASRELKINNAHICSCCKGDRKTAGGFRWVYATDYQKHISDIKPLF